MTEKLKLPMATPKERQGCVPVMVQGAVFLAFLGGCVGLGTLAARAWDREARRQEVINQYYEDLHHHPPEPSPLPELDIINTIVAGTEQATKTEQVEDPLWGRAVVVENTDNLGLVLRAEPNSNSLAITILPEGAVCYVLRSDIESDDPDNPKWLKIKCGEHTGYGAGQFLRVD